MADRKIIIEIGKENAAIVVWACRAKQETAWKFEFRENMGEPYYQWGDAKECANWIKEEFSLEDGEKSEMLFMAIGEDCLAIASEIKDEIKANNKILISSEKQGWSKALEEYLSASSKLVDKGLEPSEINPEESWIKVGKLKIGFQKLGAFELKLERKVSKPTSNTDTANNKKPEKSPDEKVEKVPDKVTPGSVSSANTKPWKPGQKNKTSITGQDKPSKVKIEDTPIANPTVTPTPTPIIPPNNSISSTKSEDLASAEDNNLAFLARIEQQKTEV